MTTGGTVTLGQPASAALTSILVLATAVWAGGLVAIFVAARVAQRTLRPRERVAFFRGLGQVYGPVGGTALILALGCGAVLVSGRTWDGLLTAATVIAACLVTVTAAGVVQARRMTRLRRDALASPGDTQLARRVSHGAFGAATLRAMIAALSLALIAVGVLLAP